MPYPYPICVAKILDKRRLNKQIIECDQILNVIMGKSTAWKNHPVVKMYSEHIPFLQHYRDCLYHYFHNNIESAIHCSDLAMEHIPWFIDNRLCDQHKRRLFTKDPEFYSMFKEYGASDVNFYIVEGKLCKYRNGKMLS